MPSHRTFVLSRTADHETAPRLLMFAKSAVATLAGILAIAAVVHVTRPIKELGALDGRRVKRVHARPFNVVTWRAGDVKGRGEMLEDLLRLRHYQNRTGFEVFRDLGSSECYYLDEVTPCYVVALGGDTFDLRFVVARSGPIGKVIDVDLAPR